MGPSAAAAAAAVVVVVVGGDKRQHKGVEEEGLYTLHTCEQGRARQGGRPVRRHSGGVREGGGCGGGRKGISRAWWRDPDGRRG